MLILTAAACSKVFTGVRNPLRRCRDNLLDLRVCVAALVLDNAHPGFLARQCERNEDRLALMPRQKRAAVNRLLDDSHEHPGDRPHQAAARVGSISEMDLECAYLHCWLI